MIRFRNYLALGGMLNARHSVLEASQSCDRLTIGLTNMYYKWAIKLFGNYKESMMIRRYIECVISLLRSYDKVFYSLFKVKIIELYLSFLLCPFIYYMKGRWSIFIWKFISYVRIIWTVWRLFYQIWHIHKIFVLHAFLLKAHGA